MRDFVAFITSFGCPDLSRRSQQKIEKGTTMKRYLILAALALSACDSPAEIAASQRLDHACLQGNIQACAAVQQRVDARNQTLATTAAGF